MGIKLDELIPGLAVLGITKKLRQIFQVVSVDPITGEGELNEENLREQVLGIQTRLPVARPNILMDFANAQSVDPSIQFARSSAAMRVSLNGRLVTSGANVPRIAYDPKSLRARGLYLERPTTNMFLQATSYTASPWTRSGGQFTVNAANGIRGASTMARFTETVDTVNTNHRLQQNITADGTTRYVFSGYFKYAGRKVLLYANGFASGCFGRFDLLAGTAFANLAVDPTLTAGIEDCGDGIFRCWFSSMLPAATAGAGFMLADQITNVPNYIGNGVDGVFVDVLMAEVGHYPSSPLLTTTAAVTRIQDLLSLSGSGLHWFESNVPGTFFFEVDPNYFYPTEILGQTIFSCAAPASVHAMRAYIYGENVRCPDDLILGPHNSKPIRLAVAYNFATGEIRSCLNGGAVAVSSITPALITLIRFGQDADTLPGQYGPLDGAISKFAGWKKVLSDSELIAITTWSTQ